MSEIFDFGERLAFSRGARQASDLASIQAMLPGCVSIRKTNEKQDREGVDYIAILRKGAKVLIDGKARAKGCSRWWCEGPELALEIHSVMPGGKYKTPMNRAKTGWTLSEAVNVDYIYFSFDPSDSVDVFLIAFQHLRVAFRGFFDAWIERYRTEIQETKWNGHAWESKCVFVPAYVVMDAIDFVTLGRCRDEDGMPLFPDI